MANPIVFLISSLCIFSLISADVYVNIDCGSSNTYVDENFIPWMGDNTLIFYGESHSVQASNSISPVLDTLRAFTTRKKNCYLIQSSKGERVLVRATFFYGNYDKKSSPPTFDLQFDGNHWATVETSITDSVYYETVYVSKVDIISVCVAQTKPGQFPFISAIQVTKLQPTMYDSLDQNYPLHLITRVAYGAKQTVRFATDEYDRIWTPAGGGDGLTSVASDALLVDTSAVSDNPPSAVLQNAVTAVSPTARIQLLSGFPSAGIPVYLNMYFSEVRELDPTSETRSFQIVIDNEAMLDKPISPPYRNTTELVASNITVSSTTTFALVPSSNSSLPPLINAMEVFQIGDVLTDGTNGDDVTGLASLQKSFDVLQNWGGDPCLPAPYSWDWIECSTDPTPRVTALNLSSFGLLGSLPDFSNMDALETIDLHNNSLDGPIPEFLATLPNLKQLNLASNHFSGPIPDSLSKKTGLKLVVIDNPDVCASGKECKTTPSSSSSPTAPTTDDGGGFNSSPRRSSGGGGAKKKKSKTPVILGTTIPISIMIWSAIGALVALRHRRKAAAVVAASTSGQANTTRPQSSPLKKPAEMLGKMGEAIINEIKINMETNQGSTVEVDLTADQTEDDGHGTTTTSTTS